VTLDALRWTTAILLLASSSADAEPDRFDAWLASEFPAADGFDFPVGDADGRGSYTDMRTGRSYDGWRVSTRFGEHYSLGIHPGEDWNGTGGGDTDLGQPVHAIAAGRVAFAKHCGRLWGNVVMIDHVFYDNHERREIRSVYVHLHDFRVKEGQVVRRRDVIGSVGQDPDRTYKAHLHLELRWDKTLSPTYWPSSNDRDDAWVKAHYEDPRSFIKTRRTLPVPQLEAALLLVDTKARRMRLVLDGKTAGSFEVAFGQADGRKRRQGDLRTPLGLYFVTEKSRGPFPGRWGAFYGGYWIKVNYPNAADAAWGRANDLLTAAQERRIAAAWTKREPTWQGSALGGGIGFHGWIDDWDLDGPRRLSWGCVVMRKADIASVFERIPVGAMVVIF
jgi:murein DD-endopeptidase MepM/ murein hydrolase activator NlpD